MTATADIEVAVRPAELEEKVAATLLCLSSGAHTIRSVRACAAKYTPVGERTVKKIVRALASRGLLRYEAKTRKWALSPGVPGFASYAEALRFVAEKHLHAV